jgi:hypothetical protein
VREVLGPKEGGGGGERAFNAYASCPSFRAIRLGLSHLSVEKNHSLPERAPSSKRAAK